MSDIKTGQKEEVEVKRLMMYLDPWTLLIKILFN